MAIRRTSVDQGSAMPRILVVDDEKDVADYLIGVVQAEGWESGVAYGGEDAVHKVIEGAWDAVLMDIRMPNLGGLETLRLMRQYNPDLPVVLFTGQARQGDILNAFRLGAYTCLLKPAESGEIVKTLKEALERPTPVEKGRKGGADDTRRRKDKTRPL